MRGCLLIQGKLSVGLETVTHSSHGKEMNRHFGLRFEILSEGYHVIINGSGTRKSLVSPNHLQDFFSTDHFSGFGSHEPKQHGFAFGDSANFSLESSNSVSSEVDPTAGTEVQLFNRGLAIHALSNSDQFANPQKQFFQMK